MPDDETIKMNEGDTDIMITTPQELEQTALSIANWIVYNNRPFVLPAENNTKVYLAVLTEDQMRKLNEPSNDPFIDNQASEEEA